VSLAPGVHLGPYEVFAPLGASGFARRGLIASRLATEGRGELNRPEMSLGGGAASVDEAVFTYAFLGAFRQDIGLSSGTLLRLFREGRPHPHRDGSRVRESDRHLRGSARVGKA